RRPHQGRAARSGTGSRLGPVRSGGVRQRRLAGRQEPDGRDGDAARVTHNESSTTKTNRRDAAKQGVSRRSTVARVERQFQQPSPTRGRPFVLIFSQDRFSTR